MKNEIQMFKNEMFGTIRMMLDNQGMPWFVGVDVAHALGYSNSRDALRKHVDADDRTSVAKRDACSSCKSRTVLINESGMYSLILSSKLSTARQFKHWVTAEVLPQIRQTGGYIPTHDADGRELTTEEVLDRADEIIGATLQRYNEPAEQCLSATEVAKSWGMQVSDFNAVLSNLGVQRFYGGRWHLNSKYDGMGLTDDRLFVYYSRRGDRRSKIYMVWTPAGIDFLNKMVGN